MTGKFDYMSAFGRNIGWLTRSEQAILAERRVAIGGMGGVGGSHLLTLTRLGVGGFTIADFDTFELANFNRQAGATMQTVGQPKAMVLKDMAQAINPDLDIRVIDEPVGVDNVAGFLDGSDVYLDGLDFFALPARRLVFAECRRRGIPAVTAAPLGFSTAILNFLPGGMSFEEYFQVDGHAEDEQLLRFFVGLAPAGLHRRSLVDPSTIDLAGHRGPSTAIGCELCAGVAAAQVIKILINRGTVDAAPVSLQFDVFTGKLARVNRPGGNRHPLQRLALHLGRKAFLRQR